MFICKQFFSTIRQCARKIGNLFTNDSLIVVFLVWFCMLIISILTWYCLLKMHQLERLKYASIYKDFIEAVKPIIEAKLDKPPQQTSSPWPYLLFLGAIIFCFSLFGKGHPTGGDDNPVIFNGATAPPTDFMSLFSTELAHDGHLAGAATEILESNPQLLFSNLMLMLCVKTMYAAAIELTRISLEILQTSYFEPLQPLIHSTILMEERATIFPIWASALEFYRPLWLDLWAQHASEPLSYRTDALCLLLQTEYIPRLGGTLQSFAEGFFSPIAVSFLWPISFFMYVCFLGLPFIVRSLNLSANTFENFFGPYWPWMYRSKTAKEPTEPLRRHKRFLRAGWLFVILQNLNILPDNFLVIKERLEHLFNIVLAKGLAIQFLINFVFCLQAQLPLWELQIYKDYLIHMRGLFRDMPDSTDRKFALELYSRHFFDSLKILIKNFIQLFGGRKP